MKLRVAVIFGGVSVEHEISILSAMQAISAFDMNAYEIIPVYISKAGNFYSDSILKDLDTFKNLEEIENKLSEVTFITRQNEHFMIPVLHHFRKKEIPFDIAFPILHGTNGEDGKFQGYLSTLSIPYVGCSTLGGAIGQDKVYMKMILQQHFTIPEWFYVEKDTYDDVDIIKKAESIGYPFVIKPANLGSSIGIEIVEDSESLQKGVEEAFQYDTRVVVEQKIEHLREINCSLMKDHQDIHVSVLEEVLKQDDILSFTDKYENNSKTKGMASASRLIPAPVSDETYQEIQETAKQVYRILQADGIARIDFLMDDETKRVYVNEINTIPGSLSFYLWEKSGYRFTKLLDMVIKQAIRTYQDNKKRTYTHKTNVLSKFQGTKGCKFKK